MNQRHLKKTEAGPLCLPDRTGAYSKQQGYVLLMAMMLLIMMATPFLYHASMETSNEMQRDQYQKIEQRLNDLKAQMILFAKYPGLFCADADNEDSEHLKYLYRFDEDDFAASGFMQFKPYEDEIQAEWLAGSDSHALTCSDYDVGSSPGPDATVDSMENACEASQELLVRLAWVDPQNPDMNSADTPVVYLYKSDLGC